MTIATVNGVIYNTDADRRLGDNRGQLWEEGNWSHSWTELYKTRNGAFYLVYHSQGAARISAIATQEEARDLYKLLVNPEVSFAEAFDKTEDGD